MASKKTKLINEKGTIARWSTVLKDKEISLLAEGVSPLLIRPDRLIYYAPAVQWGSESSEVEVD